MMCLMHDGQPYGYLKVNQKVIHVVNLAPMVGLTIELTTKLTRELEEAGVFSRDSDGCIFSRRMVRDEEIRAKRSESGHKGGNPKLKKSDLVNHIDNHIDNQTVADEDSSKHKDDLVGGNGETKRCFKTESKSLLEYLNQQANRSFRPVEEHLSLIVSRLKEPGVTIDGVKQMIDRQVRRWGNDPKFSEYLRPATLFAKSNFADYYDNRNLPVQTTVANSPKAGRKDEITLNKSSAYANLRFDDNGKVIPIYDENGNRIEEDPQVAPGLLGI